MLTYALIVFALTALGGLTLAYLRISKRGVPTSFALGHGIMAGIGLVLLVVALVQNGEAALTTILIAFAAAAVVGGVMFSFRLRTRPIPIAFILIHATLAASAFFFLVLALSK